MCKVQPCGGSSKLGGGDEECIGVGGGEGRGGEGADGGASGGGGVDFGDCGEGVPAEMLPGVGGIVGGDGGSRTNGGGAITSRGPQSEQSSPNAQFPNSAHGPPSSHELSLLHPTPNVVKSRMMCPPGGEGGDSGGDGCDGGTGGVGGGGGGGA